MVSCVLLNADYSFLSLVDWKRAMRLMAREKVSIIKYSDKAIQSASGQSIKIPLVMKLIKLIRIIYKARVPFSKRNVLVRDGFICAYCGTKAKRLTIDHIIPKSRGGKTVFENCVACCKSCNGKKDCRTPFEAKMHLKVKPYQPTISEFFRMKMKQLGIESFWEEMME